VCQLIGVAQASLDSDALVAVKGFINADLETVWRHYWWPELMRCDLRYYRADYDNATAYVVGAEVYYPTTGKYYEATDATTGNLPTDTDYWDELAEIDAYIERDQAGETEIGEVRGVYLENPLTNREARRVQWVDGPNGIHIVSDSIPASVWVWFRLPPTRYYGLATAWAAGTTYTAGQVVYYVSATAGYEGDWWECLSTTTAGQDPEDTPAKWQKRDFPETLREAVASAAYVKYLRRDDAKPEDRAEARHAAERALMQAQSRASAQQGQAVKWRMSA
jgi:hypothetical protein